MDVIENAESALVELLAPLAVPDTIVDPLIAVPDDIRLIFKSIASSLLDNERYFLDFGSEKQ